MTVLDFAVKRPHTSGGGHTEYDTEGRDSKGNWHVKRRFTDFHTLRKIIQKRFPGVPVPLIPPKQTFGNKDQMFLLDRMFYLQRFLRKLA